MRVFKIIQNWPEGHFYENSRATSTFVLFWAKVLSCRLLSAKFDQILFAGVQNNENHQWSPMPGHSSKVSPPAPRKWVYLERCVNGAAPLTLLGDTVRTLLLFLISFFLSHSVQSRLIHTSTPAEHKNTIKSASKVVEKKTPFREMTQKTLFSFHFGSRLILFVVHI